LGRSHNWQDQTPILERFSGNSTKSILVWEIAFLQALAPHTTNEKGDLIELRETVPGEQFAPTMVTKATLFAE
jgi:hypothetical protein